MPQPTQAAVAASTPIERDIPKKSSGIVDSVTTVIASLVSSIKKVFSSSNEKNVKKKDLPLLPAQITQQTPDLASAMSGIDQSMQNIDAIQTALIQRIQTVSQETKTMEQLATTMPSAMEAITQAKQQNSSLDVVNGGWKRPILLIIGKVLDGAAYVGKNVYNIFDAFFGSFIRKFIKDIQNKVSLHDIDDSKTQAA